VQKSKPSCLTDVDWRTVRRTAKCSRSSEPASKAPGWERSGRWRPVKCDVGEPTPLRSRGSGGLGGPGRSRGSGQWVCALPHLACMIHHTYQTYVT